MLQLIIVTYILCLSLFFLCNAQEIESYPGARGNYGFKDNSGETVISAKYTFVEYSGILNIFEVIPGAKYDDNYKSYSGGKWSFIYPSRKIVIPLKYDNGYDHRPFFVDGRTKVRPRKRKFYIDKAGKENNFINTKPAHDKVLPKAAATKFYKTCVIYLALVFQMNSIAEMLRLQQYLNR